MGFLISSYFLSESLGVGGDGAKHSDGLTRADQVGETPRRNHLFLCPWLSTSMRTYFLSRPPFSKNWPGFRCLLEEVESVCLFREKHPPLHFQLSLPPSTFLVWGPHYLGAFPMVQGAELRRQSHSRLRCLLLKLMSLVKEA